MATPVCYHFLHSLLLEIDELANIMYNDEEKPVKDKQNHSPFDVMRAAKDIVAFQRMESFWGEQNQNGFHRQKKFIKKTIVKNMNDGECEYLEDAFDLAFGDKGQEILIAWAKINEDRVERSIQGLLSESSKDWGSTIANINTVRFSVLSFV